MKISEAKQQTQADQASHHCSHHLASQGSNGQINKGSDLEGKDCGLWSQEPCGFKSQLHHFLAPGTGESSVINLPEPYFLHLRGQCNKSHLRGSGRSARSGTAGIWTLDFLTQKPLNTRLATIYPFPNRQKVTLSMVVER